MINYAQLLATEGLTLMLVDIDIYKMTKDGEETFFVSGNSSLKYWEDKGYRFEFDHTEYSITA